MPTAHVTGLVRDKETKEAIPFATAIFYKVTDWGLVVGDTCNTNETGRYYFDLDTAIQVYKILGNAPEYFANEIEVKKFEAGDTLNRNINIEKEYTPELPTRKEFRKAKRDFLNDPFSTLSRRSLKKHIRFSRKEMRGKWRTARKTNRKKRQPKSTG